MSQNLICPNCKALYNSIENTPQILTCKHVLCKKCCLDQLQSFQLIICPQASCQQATTQGQKDLNTFAKKQSEEDVRYTQNCLVHDNPILSYCFEDRQLLCANCQEINNHLNHKVADISEASNSLQKELPLLIASLRQFEQLAQYNCEKSELIKQSLKEQTQQFKKQIQQ